MNKCFAMLGALLIWFGCLGLTGATAQGLDQPPPNIPPPGPPPGATPAGGPGPGVNPVLRYVAPGIFEIGQCTINKEEGRVEFPASVNMKEGLLEYLLVGNSGKLHESLLRTDVEPYALQIALLLAGLEGSLSPLSMQGEDKLPTGDPVDIWLRWQEKGTERKARLEELIVQAKNPPGEVPWVFTGSVIRDGIFAAQAEKSIIAMFHDPAAMIDHRLKSGANDEIWFVNSKATPALGTRMTVSIVKKAGQPRDK